MPAPRLDGPKAATLQGGRNITPTLNLFQPRKTGGMFEKLSYAKLYQKYYKLAATNTQLGLTAQSNMGNTAMYGAEAGSNAVAALPPITAPGWLGRAGRLGQMAAPLVLQGAGQVLGNSGTSARDNAVNARQYEQAYGRDNTVQAAAPLSRTAADWQRHQSNWSVPASLGDLASRNLLAGTVGKLGPIGAGFQSVMQGGNDYQVARDQGQSHAESAARSGGQLGSIAAGTKMTGGFAKRLPGMQAVGGAANLGVNLGREAWDALASPTRQSGASDRVLQDAINRRISRQQLGTGGTVLRGLTDLGEYGIAAMSGDTDKTQSMSMEGGLPLAANKDTSQAIQHGANRNKAEEYAQGRQDQYRRFYEKKFPLEAFQGKFEDPEAVRNQFISARMNEAVDNDRNLYERSMESGKAVKGRASVPDTELSQLSPESRAYLEDLVQAGGGRWLSAPGEQEGTRQGALYSPEFQDILARAAELNRGQNIQAPSRAGYVR